MCQRLFFLLRSFIGAFEERSALPHRASEASAPAPALRLFRYAQRRLSGRMFDRDPQHLLDPEERRCSSEGYPIQRESDSSSRMRKATQPRQEYSHLTIAPSESTMGPRCETGIALEGDRGECDPPSGTLNASSHSGVDEDNDAIQVVVPQERLPSPTVAASASEDDIPVSCMASCQNHDQNSTSEIKEDGSIGGRDLNSAPSKKKSTGKKILRLLKAPGKSMRSLKKSSSLDQGSTAIAASAAGCDGDHGGGASPPRSNGKKSPKSSGKSFAFPHVFHKSSMATTPALQTIDHTSTVEAARGGNGGDRAGPISLSRKFENMAWILRQLDNSCAAIEKKLTKTFSQKVADWALYPWSASKESALASVTELFRSELRRMNAPAADPTCSETDAVTSSKPQENTRFPILNPVDPSELLTSVDADECFILPSAHFPLLLCFTSEQYVTSSPKAEAVLPSQGSHSSHPQGGGGGDTLYRTKVEILDLFSTAITQNRTNDAYVIQGTVAGIMEESGVR